MSNDDLHSHVEKMMVTLFANNDTGYSPLEPYDISSFMRSIVSSCPNPLLASNRGQCEMRFSSLGKACITVIVPNEMQAVVEVKERINSHYSMRLIISMLLLSLASQLAKSKVFQV
jgi:hypothetical protein